MRKFVFAVMMLLAAQTGFSSTTVLTEDFEDPGYVVGNWMDVNPTAPANPLIWDFTNVTKTNDTTGPNGQIVVGQPVAAGPKTLFVNDNKSDTSGTYPMLIFGMSDETLAGYNGGTGITKGTVQFDVRIAGASNHSIIHMRLYDEFPYNSTDGRLASNSLVALWFGNNLFGLNVEDRDGTANKWVYGDGTTQNMLVIGNDYRVVIDFDVAADSVTVKLIDLVTSTELGTATVPVLAASTDGFTGVKGFYVDTAGTNRQPKYHLDNFIFTAEPTGPAPEVAVTVDSNNVASGETVDFGTPAVGIPTSKVFTVENTGTVELTTQDLVLPLGYTLKSGESLEPIIAASGSDTFEVELDTTTSGEKTGNLTFTTNDSDEGSFSILLTADVGNTGVEDWTDR